MMRNPLRDAMAQAVYNDLHSSGQDNLKTVDGSPSSTAYSVTDTAVRTATTELARMERTVRKMAVECSRAGNEHDALILEGQAQGLRLAQTALAQDVPVDTLNLTRMPEERLRAVAEEYRASLTAMRDDLNRILLG